MKRVWLEAGGKSPNIVFNDAPDLKAAAVAAAEAIAFNQVKFAPQVRVCWWNRGER